MNAVAGDPVEVTWEHVLTATWAVHSVLVAAKVPAGATLDLWKGDALLSLVGLRAAPASHSGSPAATTPFDHVFLCFYVRRQTEGELRRGCVIVKQIHPEGSHPALPPCVPPATIRIAPTRHDAGVDGCIAYEWRIGEHWNRFSARRAGVAAPPADHSPEEFISDRAWVYARQQDGSVLECRFDRTPFDVAPARDVRLECEIALLFGADYLPILTRPPLTTFVGTETLVTLGKPDQVG
jgi:hypothetical protein